jgi:3-deoxy-D-manno-octulosonate 8-phosphate phosphatase (KDO 8-P phosphatase)
VLEKFKHITTFVFDVDGVLTDGSLLVLPEGVMARRMNIKDGYALQLAVKRGYHVVIISGGNSAEVKEQVMKLGIKEVWMQVENKSAVLQQFMKQHHLAKEKVLYMGDDIPDLQVMQLAGLALLPGRCGTGDQRNLCLYITCERRRWLWQGCDRKSDEAPRRLGRGCSVRSQ